MKVAKVFLCLVALLSLGCGSIYQDIYNYVYDHVADEYYSKRYSGIALYEIEGLPEFNDLGEIGRFLRDEITWVSGADTPVQTPQETWERKRGNCEDITALFMNIAYFNLNTECVFIAVNQEEMSRKIDAGGKVTHAMVEYNGVIYEPQNGIVYTGIIGYRYSFWHVFTKN